MELQDLVAPALVEECYLICRHNLKSLPVMVRPRF